MMYIHMCRKAGLSARFKFEFDPYDTSTYWHLPPHNFRRAYTLAELQAYIMDPPDCIPCNSDSEYNDLYLINFVFNYSVNFQLPVHVPIVVRSYMFMLHTL
jgi:hypothetical protein